MRVSVIVSDAVAENRIVRAERGEECLRAARMAAVMPHLQHINLRVACIGLPQCREHLSLTVLVHIPRKQHLKIRRAQQHPDRVIVRGLQPLRPRRIVSAYLHLAEVNAVALSEVPDPHIPCSRCISKRIITRILHGHPWQ